MNSRIISAANKMHCADGNVRLLIGARHWDMLMHSQAQVIILLLQSQGFMASVPSKLLRAKPEEQGFIDQFGVFFSREDAWIIAKSQNQIIRDVSTEGVLYSENLY